MTSAVVIFPESDCGRDLISVLRHSFGLDPIAIWHSSDRPIEADLLFLPGGGSLMSAFGMEKMFYFSPVLRHLLNYSFDGGNIFGIGEGFQLLCEMELLPGRVIDCGLNDPVTSNVHLRVENPHKLLTSKIDRSRIIQLPISHRWGSYQASSDDLINLRQNEQIIFRYCDEHGTAYESINYDKSIDNIAAVCNDSGNVFGMLAHPEHAIYPLFNGTDGRLIFESILSNFS